MSECLINFWIRLLVDRAVGGSSLEEGQLEIMLERQNLLDDDRGMGERLQDGKKSYLLAEKLTLYSRF